MMGASRSPASGLYVGEVVHRRFAPRKHALEYRIFSLFIDLDKIDELLQNSWLLSVNKFNLLSFHDRDYGDQSGNLKSYIRNEIEARFPAIGIEKIFMLTMPRVMGYVFNPLSIYFCFNESNSLKAILYEVSNTFGQRHNYIFDIAQPESQKYEHECPKTFYVSPFLEMGLRYKFTITNPGRSFSIAIQACRNGEVMMNAVQAMTFVELSDKNLARVFVSIPLMTMKVIAGIHLEALRLWLKGVSLVPNTSPVDKATRFIRDRGR